MSRKIATLFDNKGSDDNEDHQHSQAFYAGGSEHSGQQILGPSRDNPDQSRRLIENIFDHVRQSPASLRDPNESSVPSGNVTQLPVTFWRNGFTIGEDGELRDYTSPENRQFIECLKRGETPPELASQVRRRMVDVQMQNKSHEDFKRKTTVQPFSGVGHRLGAPTPKTVEEQQQPDKNKP